MPWQTAWVILEIFQLGRRGQLCCAMRRSLDGLHGAWEDGERQRRQMRRLLSACMVHAGLGLICLELKKAPPFGFLSLHSLNLSKQTSTQCLIEALSEQ